MAYVFQTKGKDGKVHPKFRFRYTDRFGGRITATGLTSKRETRHMAEQIEARERAIRNGQLQPDTAEQIARFRPMVDVIEEYLAWGNAQGGRKGRPWDDEHADKMRRALFAWQSALSIEHMGNCADCLAKVEKVLREAKDTNDKPLAGKTLKNRAGTLSGFFRWCVKRRYLRENPLRDLAGFDLTPKSVRRLLTKEEIDQLLMAVPIERRITYMVALASGLRLNELRSLSVADLDVENSGLRLRADWTKNRTDGFQPISRGLVVTLLAFVDSGLAQMRYKAAYARNGKVAATPANPLLFVAGNASRAFENDLTKAGVAKNMEQGRADFHSLRVAYISYLAAAGTPIKELQTLARHSTPTLTMNVYAKVHSSALAERIESFTGDLLSSKSSTLAQNGLGTCVSTQPARAYMVPERGLESTLSNPTITNAGAVFPENNEQMPMNGETPADKAGTPETLTGQPETALGHIESSTLAQRPDEGLQAIIDAWPGLEVAIQARLVAIVRMALGELG